MRHFILLFVMLITCNSCKLGTTSSISGSGISPDLKSELERINSRLFYDLGAGNIDKIKSKFSPILLDELNEKSDSLLIQMGTMIKGSSRSILQEYHIKNSTDGLTNTLFDVIGENNKYRLNIASVNAESYVLLVLCDLGIWQRLATIVYGKDSDEWKITTLHVGDYSIKGETAFNLYRKAKKSSDLGHNIEAAMTLEVARKLLYPGGGYFQYVITDEFDKLYKSVEMKIRKDYQFPIVLNNIDSKPKLLNVYPQLLSEGYFPMINYHTDLNIKDSLLLKSENDSIHDAIESIIPGISRNKQFVCYKAFEKVPDGKSMIETYGFVRQGRYD